MKRSSLVSFLLLFLNIKELTCAAEACDSCQFVESDPPNCKVYGQLGNGVLIGWNKASQECLDSHNIKVQSVDSLALTSMFPNTNGTGGNVNQFVNFLRFEEGAAVNGIQLSLTDFFVEGDGGKAYFKEEIIVNGQTYDCKTSESDCWNKGLKEYFAQEPGATVMKGIGTDLYNRQKLDREIEQSTVRIAICNAGGDDVCEFLMTQIEKKKSKNAVACSAFGLGPAENSIPGCENLAQPPYQATTGRTSSSPRTIAMRNFGIYQKGLMITLACILAISA